MRFCLRSCLILLCSTWASFGAAQSEPLVVDGYGPAALVLPARTTTPRPVVVALHGNFDRPEWMCDAWSSVVAGRAFILCPRGIRRNDAADRWELPVARRLKTEIAAARAALVARFPGKVADGPDVYVGFSQGAHRISRLAAAQPETYPRIQLVEGGASLWRAAPRYERGSGRVAIVCAVRWCETRGNRLAERLGTDRARLERIPAAHHELHIMAPATKRTFDWLVADDPRFNSGAAAASER